VGQTHLGNPWNPEEKNLPPDPKELARLLRLLKPIPGFAQEWLADLIDPHDGLYDGTRLIFDQDRRAAQKFNTKHEELEKALVIAKVMDCGLTLSEAIEVVMPKQRRQAYAMWKSAEPMVNSIRANPEIWDKLTRFFDGKLR
jgi:hypothetical protein